MKAYGEFSDLRNEIPPKVAGKEPVGLQVVANTGGVANHNEFMPKTLHVHNTNASRDSRFGHLGEFRSDTTKFQVR